MKSIRQHNQTRRQPIWQLLPSCFFASILILGISNPVNAHSETIANLTVEHAEGGLIITASLEKGILVHALRQEASCTPKDMLNICANEYVQKYIKVFINEQPMTLTKITQKLTQSSLIIKYHISFDKSKEKLEKVEIKSDYLIKYNSHARLKVISKLLYKNVSYSLYAQRKTITIFL